MGHHLKKALTTKVFKQFTEDANKGERVSTSKECFCCHEKYRAIAFKGIKNSILLDFCTRCNLLWFDKDETKEIELNTTADFLIGDSEFALEINQGLSPEAMVETLIGTIRVHHDEETLKKKSLDFPILTISMTVLFFALLKSKFAYAKLAYIPKSGLLRELISLPGHAFVHGDISHVAGNACFYLLFGSHVERYIGRAQALILFFLGVTMSGLVYRFSGMKIPLVGSSAGIFAMMGAFLRIFPHTKFEIRRVSVLWGRALSFHYSFKFPAYLFILLYLLMNILFLHPLLAKGKIHHLGHVVGFLVGYLLVEVSQTES